MPLSQDTLTELTPVQVDENTVVKVPLVANDQSRDQVENTVVKSPLVPNEQPHDQADQSRDPQTVTSLISVLEANDTELGSSAPCAGQMHPNPETDSPILRTQTEDHTNHILALTDKQLETLVSYHTNYPRLLFKNALLTLYASCDRKLDEVRKDLFQMLLNKDDFPYKHNSLKRRIQTRNGDSLVEKLAYDIHTLVSAIVDANYDSQDLRDIISSSRKSTASRSGDLTITPIRPSVYQQTRPEDQPSRSEVKDLQESIALLKSDVISIKQTLRANDDARSAEISELRDSMQQLSDDFITLKDKIYSELQSLTTALLRIDSMVSTSLTHVKNDVKLLKQDIRSCESSICLVENNVQSITNSKQARSRKNTADSRPRSGVRGTSSDTLCVTQAQRDAAVSPGGANPAVTETCQCVVDQITNCIDLTDITQQNVQRVAQSNRQDNRAQLPQSAQQSTLDSDTICDSLNMHDFPPLLVGNGSGNQSSSNSNATSVQLPKTSAPASFQNQFPNETVQPDRDARYSYISKAVTGSTDRATSGVTQPSIPVVGSNRSVPDPNRNGVGQNDRDTLYSNIAAHGTTKSLACESQGAPIPVVEFNRGGVRNRPASRYPKSNSHRVSFNTEGSCHAPSRKDDSNSRSYIQQPEYASNDYSGIRENISYSYTDNYERTELSDADRFDDDTDLSDYVRKRTRRFYVGGFKPSITEGKISGYVSRRGPKVTKVVIFRSRNKPIVIRVNVEDDSNAQLLSDPYFWPFGVICRPWVSRGRYNARNSEADGQTVNAPRGDRLYADHNAYVNPESWSNYNRYDALSGVE